MGRFSRHHGGRSWLFAALACGALLPSPGIADEVIRAGRYLDRNVLVHDPAQRNPLHRTAFLEFDSRSTIGDAIRTALTGTGYRLADPSDPDIRTLLESRVAIPHQRFEAVRIDAVVAAIAGDGRGLEVRVDHTARQVGIFPAEPGGPH